MAEIGPESGAILACMTWSADLASLPQNKVDKCEFCGGSIVVSETGLKLRREKELSLACQKCISESPSAEVPPTISPEIREEVLRITGWDPLKVFPAITAREGALLLQRLEERRSHS